MLTHFLCRAIGLSFELVGGPGVGTVITVNGVVAIVALPAPGVLGVSSAGVDGMSEYIRPSRHPSRGARSLGSPASERFDSVLGGLDDIAWAEVARIGRKDWHFFLGRVGGGAGELKSLKASCRGRYQQWYICESSWHMRGQR